MVGRKEVSYERYPHPASFHNLKQITPKMLTKVITATTAATTAAAPASPAPVPVPNWVFFQPIDDGEARHNAALLSANALVQRE